LVLVQSIVWQGAWATVVHRPQVPAVVTDSGKPDGGEVLEIHGNLEIPVMCVTDRGVKRVQICALDLVFWIVGDNGSML